MTNKPELTISRIDAQRLERLLDAADRKAIPGHKELEEELLRANIVEPEEVPATVVTMNSSVRFKVASTGSEFTLKLVYPKDVDGSGGTISVLAPVGSALLGLSEGDRITWPAPGGAMLDVEIIEVLYQPERSGDLNL